MDLKYICRGLAKGNLRVRVEQIAQCDLARCQHGRIHALSDFVQHFDVALTYDVLHDSTQPANLIAQVKTALQPQKGVWLLADLPAQESVRANLAHVRAPDTYYGFSMCLCMSCGLSEPNGAGLGTLGFSIPVSRKLLTQGGFRDIQVLLEEDNARWFQVQ